MTKEEFIDYCRSTYDAQVDHPFKDYPEFTAIRHHNGKWFALAMTIPASRLGLDSSDPLEVVNLKVDPELNSILQGQAGYFPAYHMSKKHWLSVRLDAFTIDELAALIDGSFAASRK